MVEHGISRRGVIAWPRDQAAAAALNEYLRANAGLSANGIFESLAAPQFDFSGANLSGLDLSEAYLLGARLNGISLAGADLSRATLSGAELEKADLSDARLVKAEIVEALANHASLRAADAFAADFSRSEMRYVDASAATLNSARFNGTDLSYANLREAVLASCRFGNYRRPTKLVHAQLAGASLDGAAGVVIGPVDVGPEGKSALLSGADLGRWFVECGAQEVTVVED